MTVRGMTCFFCGDHAGRWEQHWNRDTGYGICKPCVLWQKSRGMTDAEVLNLYGQEGINWGYNEPRSRVRHAGTVELWVVEVLSPVINVGWIVQGEHHTKEAAEADLENWCTS